MSGILEYSQTPATNTAVNGIGITGSSSLTLGDDAIRQMMADSASAITRSVTKAAGTYSAAKTDFRQLWRATGAVTINLTAAATLTDGWCLWVKADGGAVTIDPSGAEQINGAATLTVPDGTSAFVVCTGTAFFAITMARGVAISSFIEALLDDANGAAAWLSLGGLTSNASSGYVKLPNGLYIQWGTTVGTTNVNGVITVTFPIAFPNTKYTFIPAVGDVVNAIYCIAVNSTTLTSHEVVFKVSTTGNSLGSGSNLRINWIAVGI